MSEPSSEFEKEAQRPRRGSAAELVAFLRDNKKWWLIPILVVIVLFGVVVALGATGAAPVIYTLF
jgi:hypothetical protein